MDLYTCSECFRTANSNPGMDQITHTRSCVSRPQVAGQPKVNAADVEDARLESFAREVRRTGLTKGRDEDVVEAVRRGYLSLSDAMNSDD